MSAVGGCSGAGGCAVAFASTESLAADSRFSGMVLVYIPVSYLLSLLVLQSIVSLLHLLHAVSCVLCLSGLRCRCDSKNDGPMADVKQFTYRLTYRYE